MPLKIALVTGGTPNLAGPAGVAYLSLRCFSPQLFENADKYFFTTGNLDSKSLQAFNKLGIKITLLNAESGLSKNASSFIKYFSAGILAKFEPFRLAEFYDRVVWMDVDQINTRDLYPIIRDQVNEFGITSGGKGSTVLDNFIKDPSILYEQIDLGAIDFGAPGVCGNFFVVKNFKIGSYGRARELFFRLQEDLYGPDQGVICILMQEIFTTHNFYDHQLFTPHPQDWLEVNLDPCNNKLQPYFLHTYGQPKFWNGFKYPLWEKFYDEWVNIGGKQFYYNPSLSSLKAFIKRCLKRLRSLYFCLANNKIND